MKHRVPLVCGIERSQHVWLRRVAFERGCSLADVVRAAIDEYARSREALDEGRLDPVARAREKSRARARDERALRTGARSRGRLRRENGLLRGLESVIDFDRVPDLE